MIYFQTIEAFYKILLSNSTDDIQKQIKHLRTSLKKEGDQERAQALNKILTTTQNSINLEPFRLIKLFRSFTNNENRNV